MSLAKSLDATSEKTYHDLVVGESVLRFDMRGDPQRTVVTVDGYPMVGIVAVVVGFPSPFGDSWFSVRSYRLERGVQGPFAVPSFDRMVVVSGRFGNDGRLTVLEQYEVAANESEEKVSGPFRQP